MRHNFWLIWPLLLCWREYCFFHLVADLSAAHLATFMKFKFAGLIRNLLGRGETSQPEPTADAPRQVAPPANQPSAPASSSSTPGDATAWTPTATEPDPEHSDEIGIPLLSITNALPMDLKAKLVGNPVPGRLLYFPLEGVISQLAFGAVKITFGELRQRAAGLFVGGLNATYDSRPVTLPLNEILARINPNLLARRPASQKVEISDEIAGPFGGQGSGITFSDQPLKGGTPMPSTPRSFQPTPCSPLRRDLKPASPLAPPRETKPAAPISFNPPPTPAVPSIPLTEPPKTAKHENGNGLPYGNRIGNGHGNGHSSGNGVGKSNGNGQVIGQSDRNQVKAGSVLPPFKFTTTPASSPSTPKPGPTAPVPPAFAPISMAKPATAPAPKPAAPSVPTFSVPLSNLSEKWPEEVKGEILAQCLGQARVPLPLPTIEPGLKRGRVTLAWRDIRSLINPNSAPSTVDDLELDLPLATVAPAFLAAQRKISAQAQARVEVSEEIPNLFFGFPQPETSAPTAPTTLPPNAGPVTPAALTPSPAFRPSPLPRPAPAASETSADTAPKPPLQSPLPLRNGDTNIFSVAIQDRGAAGDSTLFRRVDAPATDFLSRQMQPKEVVAHALSLPGVAGAVVALADGLRVAGQVPAEFNADTVAAFLPQIFERVNQSTRELRMGTLNNVSFTVGNVPWKIYRVGSIYFAVFGRADEHFPKAELAQLAAGLNRKSKQ
jgi:predicted regulator of Ras-like GTPase activity (Roadblock/LC7/MglB family)